MIGQLVLLFCGCALLAIAFGLLVRHERGWVWRWKSGYIMELIDTHQIVVNSGVPGMVYLINKEALRFPPEERKYDVAYSEPYLRRFYKDGDGTVEWLMKYSYTFKLAPGMSRSHAVIKNLTSDGIE